MPEPTITAVLSPSEWRLVQGLRGLPESKLRNRMDEVLEGLLFYVRNPRCEGIGVEGFPCGDPVTTCEECHQIWDLLESIAERVEQSCPKPRQGTGLRLDRPGPSLRLDGNLNGCSC